MKKENDYIQGKFRISDCENYGDVQSAVDELRHYGCTILNAFWDGKDCGEAYVNFEFVSNNFKTIYNRFHFCSEFDADINDYIEFKNESEFPLMDSETFNMVIEGLKYHVDNGFEKRIPLSLYMEIENNKYGFEELAKEALSLFEGCKVLCYRTKYARRFCEYQVLFTIDYNVLRDRDAKKEVTEFFKKKKMYGNLFSHHVLSYFCHDEILIERIESVLAKKELVYITSRYDHKLFPYSEYTEIKDGIPCIKETIENEREPNNYWYLKG